MLGHLGVNVDLVPLVVIVSLGLLAVCIETFSDVPELHWDEGRPEDSVAMDPEFLIKWFDSSLGLPSMHINDLEQTADGYLWFATADGLARYDGVNVMTLGAEKLGRAGPDVPTAMWSSPSKAQLWVSHFGGLSRVSPLSSRYWPLDEVFRPERVWRMWPNDGALLLSWHRSLLRFSEEQYRRIAFETVDWGEVLSVAQLPSSELVVGGSKGVWRWSGASDDLPLEILTADGESAKRVDRILQLSNGRVLLSRPWGLGELRGQFVVPLLRYRRNDRAVHTSFLFQARDGEVWLGVSGLGVFRLRADDPGYYREMPYFNGINLGDGLQDHEGGFWIVSGRHGVGRMWRRPVKSISPSWRNRTSRCHAVLPGPRGEVWVGTNAGIFFFQDGKSKHFSSPKLEDGVDVRCLAFDTEGRLWYSTASGIGLLSDGHYYEPSADVCPLSDQEIARCIIARRDGTLWVAAQRGLFKIDPSEVGLPVAGSGESWLCLPERERIAFSFADGEPLIQEMYEDSDSTLWLGTAEHGLLRESVDKDHWIQIGEQSGLSSMSVTDICHDQKGRLWVGSSRGLNLLTNGRVYSITTAQGLHDDVINSVDSDGVGGLWLGCNKGIVRLLCDELAESLVSGQASELQQIVYTQADGMPVSETYGGHGQSSAVLGDGRLCFATHSGVALVDPNNPFTVTNSPPVTLRRVEVDQKVVKEWLTFDPAAVPKLIVPPGTGHLVEIFFSANTFSGSGQIAYRYRLDGLGSDWIEVDEGRSAVYTDLRPGNYRFTVVAANRHGAWNRSGASLELEVLPTIVQTLWFRMSAGLCFLAVIYEGHRRRLRRRDERSRFELAIGLEKERARIAGEMHDDLGNQLARIAYLSSGADAPGATHRNVKISSIARDSIGTLNEIIWAMSSENDTVGELCDYLQEYAARLADDTGGRVLVTVDVSETNQELSSFVRRNVFLVFKEALNNAIKHSGTSTVWLTLRCIEGNLNGSVRDEGLGLPEGVRRASGQGLVNMKKRVRSLGGELSVNSSPGQGVNVSFVVAMKSPKS